jgi:hypothetical protein
MSSFEVVALQPALGTVYLGAHGLLGFMNVVVEAQLPVTLQYALQPASSPQLNGFGSFM